jgi:O-antigen/teichoic acid export membrane protein
MVQREGGKMLLGAQLGPTPVAYLGTPDNVAQRIHMVVASGSETLMPRFSANRSSKVAQELFLHGTWASLVVSLVLLLPFVLLLPDFLRLWISPEFARESARLGQMAALSYIAQGAYAPAATFFRGIGKPWLVTVVIFFAGAATVGSSLVLVPRHGIIGVGYAYLLGSVPAVVGLLHCWFHMFGWLSYRGLFRLIGLPLTMGGIAIASEYAVRSFFAELNWFSLFLLGGGFAAWMAALILGADWALGGATAPSKRFLASILESEKLASILRFGPMRIRLLARKAP